MVNNILIYYTTYTIVINTIPHLHLIYFNFFSRFLLHSFTFIIMILLIIVEKSKKFFFIYKLLIINYLIKFHCYFLICHFSFINVYFIIWLIIKLIISKTLNFFILCLNNFIFFNINSYYM